MGDKLMAGSNKNSEFFLKTTCNQCWFHIKTKRGHNVLIAQKHRSNALKS